MHIEPQRLLVLRAVAEAGGVGAAARSLRLAPSGISQHLAALERETGLVLIDRSRRGGQRPIQLTAAGRRLAEHAAHLATVLADVEADVLALTGEAQGHVRLSAFPTAIRGLVVPAVTELRASQPAVEPVVVELDEAFAMPRLQAGDLDLMLVEDDAQHPDTGDRRRGTGWVRTWLLDDPYRLAVPTAWPAPATVGDLADRPWVDGPPGSAVSRVLGRLRITTGLSLSGVHFCREFPAVLSLVDAGLGAALVPDLALADAPPPHVRVLDLPGLGARRISAVHRSGRHTRPVVRVLLDALTEAANARP